MSLTQHSHVTIAWYQRSTSLFVSEPLFTSNENHQITRTQRCSKPTARVHASLLSSAAVISATIHTIIVSVREVSMPCYIPKLASFLTYPS